MDVEPFDIVDMDVMVFDDVRARLNGGPVVFSAELLAQLLTLVPTHGQDARSAEILMRLFDVRMLATKEIIPNDPTLLDDATLVAVVGDEFMDYAKKAGGLKGARKLLKGMLKQLETAEEDETASIDWKPLKELLSR